MNEAKLKLAEHKFKQACGTFKCPLCQRESELNLSAGEFQILSYDINEDGQASQDGAKFISVALHTCPHCGFVAHFNLM